MRSTFARLSALAALALTTAQSVCNGHAELCNYSYGNVTFIGAHGSYAVGSSVADNQDKDLIGQLTDGIRTMAIQMHSTSNGIQLCHSSCALQNGGSLTSYLTTLAGWINSNPTEVVTLVMVNSDNQAPSVIAPSFQQAGLSSKVYTPPAASQPISAWPTLGQLVNAGTTLVVFMDYNADYSSVPWIIDEFSNMFEDAYDVTEQSFSCSVNRTSGSPGSQLMMINHFLDVGGSFAGTNFFIPDKAELNVTNAVSGYGSIGYHVGNCVGLWGRNPNHILLDFYDSTSGAPFQLAAQMNNVPAPTNVVTPGAASQQTNATSPSSSSSSNPNGFTTQRLGSASRVELLSVGTLASLAIGVLGVVGGAARIL